MAAREVLTLVESTPEIRAPITGDTYTMPRALAIAGETITAAANALSVTQPWNNAGVPFTGALFNFSGASAAASLLMDLQFGGVSQFNVSKIGKITVTQSASYLTPFLSTTGDATSGLSAISTVGLGVVSNGIGIASFFSSGGNPFVLLKIGTVLGWGGADINGAHDSAFSRISAALMGVGNGTAGDFSGGLKMTNLTINRAATFLSTSLALTNGAGASAGTITNAPAVGNPTKWIGIDDNGTTRYIPAW